MPAYRQTVGRSWSETAVACMGAAAGDVVVTGLVVALAVATTREPGLARSTLLAGTALAAAVAIERAALAVGRWSYTSTMPVFPGLEVGLWPVLQMPLIVSVSFTAASRLLARTGGTRGERWRVTRPWPP